MATVQSTRPWTRERKNKLLLGILDGRTSVEEACREHGLTEPQVESWVMENMEVGSSPLLFVWTLASPTSPADSSSTDRIDEHAAPETDEPRSLPLVASA